MAQTYTITKKTVRGDDVVLDVLFDDGAGKTVTNAYTLSASRATAAEIATMLNIDAKRLLAAPPAAAVIATGSPVTVV